MTLFLAFFFDATCLYGVMFPFVRVLHNEHVRVVHIDLTWNIIFVCVENSVNAFFPPFKNIQGIIVRCNCSAVPENRTCSSYPPATVGPIHPPRPICHPLSLSPAFCFYCSILNSQERNFFRIYRWEWYVIMLKYSVVLGLNNRTIWYSAQR